MERLITSIMTPNAFPAYTDGDVLIVITPDQQYQLHSQTLRNNSDSFRELLTEDKAVVLASKAKKNGVKVRWRQQLKLRGEGDADAAEHVEGEEHASGDLDPQGHPRHKPALSTLYPNHFHLSTNPEINALHAQYDNLLRCYFHQPPTFSSTSFSATLSDVVGLTDVAESLGSISVVSNALDITLANQGETLFRSIAVNAAAWADLAVRIRSCLLWKESVIHLVGQWNRLSDPENTDSAEVLTHMRPEVRSLVEKKAKTLDERKKVIELRILGHYPASLQVLQAMNQNVGPGSRTVRNSGAQPTRAAAYGNKVMDWMALNLFRHWLGQSIAGEMSRRAPDGGLAFYSAIAEGQERYIDQAEREAFARHFPFSAKARTQFDRALWEIKQAVKGYVGELVERKCQLEIDRWPLAWLVCTEVTREDCPWLAEEKERQEREEVFGVQTSGSRVKKIKEAEAKKGKTKSKGSEEVILEDLEGFEGRAEEGWEMIQRKSKRAECKRGQAGTPMIGGEGGASTPLDVTAGSNSAIEPIGSKLTETAGLGLDDEEESDPRRRRQMGRQCLLKRIQQAQEEQQSNASSDSNPEVSTNLAFGFDASKQHYDSKAPVIPTSDDGNGSVIDVTENQDVRASIGKVDVDDDDDEDNPATKRRRHRSRSEKSYDRRSKFAERNGTGGAAIAPAFFMEFDDKQAPESYANPAAGKNCAKGLEMKLKAAIEGEDENGDEQFHDAKEQ